MWQQVGQDGMDYAGSGGGAGEGGIVYYYNKINIYAYNGDRITNGDYDTEYYEYNVDGTVTGNKLTVLKKSNEEKFIPARIFAQDGTIRATYKTNQHMSKTECTTYGVPYVPKSSEEQTSMALTSGNTRNVKITNETTTLVTEYGQGIGSGAGYLEKSNGIFKHISELSE